MDLFSYFCKFFVTIIELLAIRTQLLQKLHSSMAYYFDNHIYISTGAANAVNETLSMAVQSLFGQ